MICYASRLTDNRVDVGNGTKLLSAIMPVLRVHIYTTLYGLTTVLPRYWHFDASNRLCWRLGLQLSAISAGLHCALPLHSAARRGSNTAACAVQMRWI